MPLYIQEMLEDWHIAKAYRILPSQVADLDIRDVQVLRLGEELDEVAQKTAERGSRRR